MIRKKVLFGGVARIQRDNYSNDKTKWWDIRKRVFERDKGKCQSRGMGGVCGAPANEVHHIIPLTRGGANSVSNLISLCKTCHDHRHHHLRK